VDAAEFCGSEGGMKAHIIRPGYFVPSRAYPADWQNQRSALESAMDRILSPVMGTLLPSYVSPVAELSRMTLEVAKGRWPDVDLFHNKLMRELAREI
jgi:hypothetical protein